MNKFSRSINQFVIFAATGFGIGFIHYFPGTFASLFSAVLYWFFIPEDLIISGIIILVIVIISIFISGTAEKIYNKKDDRRIVIDEITGFWIAMYSIPKKLVFTILGFIIFRLFDALKLPVIKKVENFPSGVGVVLDDVLAGLLTNVLLQLFLVLFKNTLLTY